MGRFMGRSGCRTPQDGIERLQGGSRRTPPYRREKQRLQMGAETGIELQSLYSPVRIRAAPLLVESLMLPPPEFEPSVRAEAENCSPQMRPAR